MKGKPSMPCNAPCAFAIRFDEWLRNCGRKSRDVAAELGQTESTISLWRSGKRCPTLAQMKDVSEYTRIPLCEMICLHHHCGKCDCAM